MQVHTTSDRRHEALGQVAEPVVVIAPELEQVLHPEPERGACIGVVAAVHQDQCVHPDQDVQQRRQRKAAGRRQQDRNGDDHRRDLQPPGNAFVGPDAGQDERRQHDGQHRQQGPPRPGVLRVVHEAAHHLLPSVGDAAVSP